MIEQDDVLKTYIFRLQEKIDGWTKEKVLLYGAGEHSIRVLEKIVWGKVKLLGFLDRSEKKQREGFRRYPVFHPERLSETGASKVVISSLSFQEDIYNSLNEIGLPGVEIVKLYKEKDLLAFIKNRYSCCQKNGEVRSELTKNLKKYMAPVEKNRSPGVLLIQPPFSIGNHRHKKILPVNLLYLSAFILKKNPNAGVQILDGQIFDFSLEEFKTIISRESWDIIGMGYWTGQASFAFELSKFIREKTGSLLVHGGVHPTLCPEESTQYCDITVVNEGEETFSKIVNLFPDREKIFSIPGIARYGENGAIFSTPRPSVKDLDDIPFPAFKLIPDLRIYDPPMHVTGGLRLPIIGSRGCPYSCTFCSSPLVWDRKVRWRSPSNIVDEMDYAIQSFGITQFHFWDDNIMLNKDHVIKLSEEILHRRLEINWCGLTRASHVIKNKDALPLMKKSGCVGIEIGIESFMDDSTDIVEKGEGVEDMKEASRFMEESGIAPLYTHMLFNPGENIDSYREKQKFLDEINKKNTAYLADSRLGQASTPHRKTKFESEAKMLGEVFLKNHSTYIHHRINFIPYSLLEDVPIKTGEKRESPLKFLEIIMQTIFDWDEAMIEQYLEVVDRVWEKVDGLRSVGELCEEIKKDLSLDNYRGKIFCCLAIVGLAREGKIISSQGILHRSRRNSKNAEGGKNYVH